MRHGEHWPHVSRAYPRGVARPDLTDIGFLKEAYLLDKSLVRNEMIDKSMFEVACAVWPDLAPCETYDWRAAVAQDQASPAL